MVIMETDMARVGIVPAGGPVPKKSVATISRYLILA